MEESYVSPKEPMAMIGIPGIWKRASDLWDAKDSDTFEEIRGPRGLEPETLQSVALILLPLLLTD